MEIVSFKEEYLPEMAALFVANFARLRVLVPALPDAMESRRRVISLLRRLFDDKPGAIALDDGRVVGYLGAFLVDGFRGTERRAAYVPEWGHAAASPDVYRALYREMSARWHDTRRESTAPALAEDDPEIRAALESLLSAESADPALLAGRAQVRETICAALDYLPAPYADILEWKYVRDMSVAEIAQRLGRSAKATESLLTRAREAFRETFTLLRGDAAGAP